MNVKDLVEMIKYDDIDSVLRIINQENQHQNFEVNDIDDEGNTILHYAVAFQSIDIIKALLRHSDIDVNIINNDEESALHTAVQVDDVEIIKTLLEHESLNVNCVNIFQETPLHYAIQIQKDNVEDVVSALLNNANTDVNAADSFLATPLHVTTKKTLVDILIKHQEININALDSCKATPLQILVCEDCLDVVKSLLTSPYINVNNIDNDGFTALDYAIKNSDINSEMIEILIANKAIVNNIEDIKSSFNERTLEQLKEIFLSAYKGIEKIKISENSDSLASICSQWQMLLHQLPDNYRENIKTYIEDSLGPSRVFNLTNASQISGLLVRR